jgi:1,2-phenylacetyl-CoA epoxidase PaaB subunit
METGHTFQGRSGAKYFYKLIQVFKAGSSDPPHRACAFEAAPVEEVALKSDHQYRERRRAFLDAGD